MGDPRQRLPSLENPKWLIDLIVAFPDPHLIQKFTNQYLAQVNLERMARLAALSEVTAPTRARVAAEAFNNRFSEEWNKKALRVYEGQRGSEYYGPGDYKCNLFVYEMMKQAGARVELELRENKIGVQIAYPPLARHWADPSFAIPGFEVLTVPPDVPQPGDVAAIKNVSFSASGHVGIVVGPPQSASNMTVSARADGAVHNDWGFRDENKGQVVFRRYVGWPEHGGSSPEPGMKTSGVAYETVPPPPEKPRERNKCASPGRGNGR